MEDLVNFPAEGCIDTGEGGLAVFFVLLTSRDKRRQKCIAGQGAWPIHDVVLGPKSFQKLEDELDHKRIDENLEWAKFADADLVALVGSTKKSLVRESTDDYFIATEHDLTQKGHLLYDLLAQVYGEKPDIVTLLDT